MRRSSSRDGARPPDDQIDQEVQTDASVIEPFPEGAGFQFRGRAELPKARPALASRNLVRRTHQIPEAETSEVERLLAMRGPPRSRRWQAAGEMEQGTHVGAAAEPFTSSATLRTPSS